MPNRNVLCFMLALLAALSTHAQVNTESKAIKRPKINLADWAGTWTSSSASEQDRMSVTLVVFGQEQLSGHVGKLELSYTDAQQKTRTLDNFLILSWPIDDYTYLRATDQSQQCGGGSYPNNTRATVGMRESPLTQELKVTFWYCADGTIKLVQKTMTRTKPLGSR
jgi:hypothetical protein